MSESKIIKGTFSLALSTVIVKLLGLIYKIPLAALLGDEGMGYFNSAYTVYAFFYLICTAGVPKAVMILTSEAKAKGDVHYERRIVDVCYRAFLLFGLAVSAIFIALSKPLANMIGNSKAALTMVAIAPSIIFISLAGVIRGYLTAGMKMLDIAVSQILEGVGKLAFGLIFAMLGIKLKMPLQTVSAFTILGVTLGALAGLIYLLICSKILKTTNKAGQKYKITKNKLILKRLLSISIPITVSAAAMSITNIIDLALIMRGLQSNGYSEATATALYGNYTTLAVPMFNLGISILTPVSISFIPSFTAAVVRGDRGELFRLTKKAMSFCAFLSAPITLGLAFYSKEILSLLFKGSQAAAGAPLLLLLSPAIVFSSVLLILNSILETSGRVRAPIFSMLTGSLFKIVVSYFLISKSNFGIMGAPLGTVVCYATSLICSSVIFVKHFKRIPPIFSTSFASYMEAGVAVFVSKLVYNQIYDKVSGIISLGIAILISAIIYFTMSALFGSIPFGKRENFGKTIQISV